MGPRRAWCRVTWGTGMLSSGSEWLARHGAWGMILWAGNVLIAHCVPSVVASLDVWTHQTWRNQGAPFGGSALPSQHSTVWPYVAVPPHPLYYCHVVHALCASACATPPSPAAVPARALVTLAAVAALSYGVWRTSNEAKAAGA